MEHYTIEIKKLNDRIDLLQKELAYERALWAEVWKAYRMADTAIARAMGLGEFRNSEVPKKELAENQTS